VRGRSISSRAFIALEEWRRIEAGLQQRARALNLFIDDIYHGQRIVRDGVFPREYLADSATSASSASASIRRRASGRTSAVRIWCAGADRHDVRARRQPARALGVSYISRIARS